jgi:hypothetical protein
MLMDNSSSSSSGGRGYGSRVVVVLAVSSRQLKQLQMSS